MNIRKLLQFRDQWFSLAEAYPLEALVVCEMFSCCFIKYQSEFLQEFKVLKFINDISF